MSAKNVCDILDIYVVPTSSFFNFHPSHNGSAIMCLQCIYIFISFSEKWVLIIFSMKLLCARHQNRIFRKRDNCNLLQKPLLSSQVPNAFLPSFVSPQFSFFFFLVFFTTSFAISLYLSVSFGLRLNKYSFILTSFGWFVGFYGCPVIVACGIDRPLGEGESRERERANRNKKRKNRKRRKTQKYHKRT